MEFNKKEFHSLLQLAIGERTITTFSEESGVNRTYISKYINCRLDSPPSPDLLMKLASVSYNGITYRDLMAAAGYIDINKDNLKGYYNDVSLSSFGDRLKILRTEKELTQAALAKILNMQNTAISKYELNEREPDQETLIKIADFFNVTVDWLLGRNDYGQLKENTTLDTPEDVIRFTLTNPSIINYAGYDFSNMNNEEIMDLINNILFAIKLSVEKVKSRKD